MRFTQRVFYTCVIIHFLSSQLLAQIPFREGILTYKADTIKRIEPSPAGYIPSQIVVYKKGDLLRIEVWRVNRFDPADVQKDIHIRNRKGTYLFIESSNPMMAVANNFALFMSYEDEKQYQAEQALQGVEIYRIDKLIQKIKWLNMPAEKVSLEGGPKNEPLEAIITTAIDIPIGVFFDPVRKLPGTPLQFTINERGWSTRLTAISLTSQPVTDAFFSVDPKRKLMSLDEMGKSISDFK